MKQAEIKQKSNVFTKLAVIIIPIVLIVFAFSAFVYFTYGRIPRAGEMSVYLPLAAAALAVVGIVLAIISAGIDDKREKNK